MTQSIPNFFSLYRRGRLSWGKAHKQGSVVFALLRSATQRMITLNIIFLVLVAVVAFCEFTFGWFGPSGYGPLFLAISAPVLTILAVTKFRMGRRLLTASITAHILVLIALLVVLARVGPYAGWYSVAFATLTGTVPLLSVFVLGSRLVARRHPSPRP